MASSSSTTSTERGPTLNDRLTILRFTHDYVSQQKAVKSTLTSSSTSSTVTSSSSTLGDDIRLASIWRPLLGNIDLVERLFASLATTEDRRLKELLTPLASVLKEGLPSIEQQTMHHHWPATLFPHIWMFLNAHDVMIATLVCRQWLRISQLPSTWRVISEMDLVGYDQVVSLPRLIHDGVKELSFISIDWSKEEKDDIDRLESTCSLLSRCYSLVRLVTIWPLSSPSSVLYGYRSTVNMNWKLPLPSLMPYLSSIYIEHGPLPDNIMAHEHVHDIELEHGHVPPIWQVPSLTRLVASLDGEASVIDMTIASYTLQSCRLLLSRLVHLPTITILPLSLVSCRDIVVTYRPDPQIGVFQQPSTPTTTIIRALTSSIERMLLTIDFDEATELGEANRFPNLIYFEFSQPPPQQLLSWGRHLYRCAPQLDTIGIWMSHIGGHQFHDLMTSLTQWRWYASYYILRTPSSSSSTKPSPFASVLQPFSLPSSIGNDVAVLGSGSDIKKPALSSSSYVIATMVVRMTTGKSDFFGACAGQWISASNDILLHSSLHPLSTKELKSDSDNDSGSDNDTDKKAETNINSANSGTDESRTHTDSNNNNNDDIIHHQLPDDYIYDHNEAIRSAIHVCESNDRPPVTKIDRLVRVAVRVTCEPLASLIIDHHAIVRLTHLFDADDQNDDLPKSLFVRPNVWSQSLPPRITPNTNTPSSSTTTICPYYHRCICAIGITNWLYEEAHWEPSSNENTDDDHDQNDNDG
jgi:hypothetical protein